MPSTLVPIGYPNSSPSPALTDGAGPTTTTFSGSAIAARTLSISLLSVSAPTGQTLIHCPQAVQEVFAKSLEEKKELILEQYKSAEDYFISVVAQKE